MNTLFPPRYAPVPEAELTEILARAIRTARGSREADLFLAGLCAATLADQIALAGLRVIREVGRGSD